MTKRRAPLSTDAALARIAGLLPGGFEQMAALVERSPRTVRNWGDPDTGEDIPIGCAILLDLAYRANGGEGYPLRDAYDSQLEIAEAAAFADRFELLAHAGEVIREGGEAHAALVRACAPDAGPAERANAFREASEAYETLKRVLPLLTPAEARVPASSSEAVGHQRAPP